MRRLPTAPHRAGLGLDGQRGNSTENPVQEGHLDFLLATVPSAYANGRGAQPSGIKQTNELARFPILVRRAQYRRSAPLPHLDKP
jgi:hypothetical protein